ncbi:MAG TPA: methylmalonyl Co-A mutase-associated GTPase MeaB [Propionibacteriaceae bacterium]|nr:methylmalonyl Co-A mutase-associated GTPase MeaB [Propionibacteriaceae bacterium]
MAYASLDALIEGVRAGHPRAVGRLLTLIENEAPVLRSAISRLAADTGRAHVVGVTGAPGVGKSTTTTALVSALRAAGQRVGVLAVDPSSPFSGGALLGDRVRMQQHALDSHVFIRSMATRGHLGGLSVAAPQALRVFDAAGCDTVLVETVGVGQSEVEVAAAADTVLVLLAPGMGDGIQAAKAGILEVGDIFVVNKGDREGAQSLVRDLRTMVGLGAREDRSWVPPILRTVASTSEGIAELLAGVQRARRHAEATGHWQQRRLDRARAEVEALALAQVRSTFSLPGRVGLLELAAAVRDGALDPYSAADQLLAEN